MGRPAFDPEIGRSPITRRRAIGSAGLLAAGVVVDARLRLPPGTRPNIHTRAAAARGLATPTPAAPSVATPDAAAPGVLGTPAASPVPALPLPDSPVGRQLAWILAEVNAAAGAPTEAEVREHFSAEFLAAVPPPQIIAGFAPVAAIAPLVVEGYEEDPAGTQANALVAGRGGTRLVATVVVEPVAPFRIAGARFEPYEELGTPEPLASWDEFDRRWSAFAPRANLFAAEIVNGDLRPVHALNAADRLAIGSTFKLYVLGELARQIAAGTASWDQALAIRDDWKSLPSGDYRLLPAGTRRTLRQFAEQMISVSDNTATDHLLFTLGRENVEAVQAEMGHAAPTANVPFLSTRELFALKLALPAAAVDAYLAAPVAEKRRLLATEVAAADPTLADAADWRTPIRIETIEWFAAAEDMARAMLRLHVWSREPALAPVAEILAINPALPLDPAVWPYVGAKGGSEVGVLNLTWLLRRRDDRWFVLSAGLNDPAAPLDDLATARLLLSATELLAAAS